VRRVKPRAPKACANALHRARFVEVFSGCGKLSKAMIRKGIASEAWDICLGEDFNLLRPKNVKRLVKSIQQSGICGVHLGTPCTTLSMARRPGDGPPPLRSAEHLWGLPDLKGKNAQKVQDANTLVHLTLRIMRECIRLKIPCTIENPRTSRLWQLPPVKNLFERHKVQLVHFEMCQYGTAWRKSTTLACYNFPEAEALGRRCSAASGCCSRTGCKHFILQGQDAAGNWLTARAQAYPTQLCNAYANAMVRHEFNEHLHSAMKLLKPTHRTPPPGLPHPK
jgi:hypothetical protein